MDSYQNVAVPSANHYRFQIEPKNKEIFESTIQTARELYPPFSLYLEWVIKHPGIVQPFKIGRRNNYPAYLEHASTFEILRVYQGPCIKDAETLIYKIHEITDTAIQEKFERYMFDHGYFSQPIAYDGSSVQFVKIAHPLFRANTLHESLSWSNHENAYNPLPLTPANLQLTITLDQKLTMAAWKNAALHGGITNKKNKDLWFAGSRENKIPLIQGLGYNKDELLDVIIQVQDRLPRKPMGNRDPRKMTESTLDRTYLTKEEQCLKRSGVNITHRALHSGQYSLRNMPQAYLMMLYSELAQRGIIDENGQITL